MMSSLKKNYSPRFMVLKMMLLVALLLVVPIAFPSALAEDPGNPPTIFFGEKGTWQDAPFVEPQPLPTQVQSEEEEPASQPVEPQQPAWEPETQSEQPLPPAPAQPEQPSTSFMDVDVVPQTEEPPITPATPADVVEEEPAVPPVAVLPEQPAQEPPPATILPAGSNEQMRAVWATAMVEGFRNKAEVDELIANVVRANANTIFVQIRRHGDAWYNKGIEPRAADDWLAPAEEFDPLAYMLTQAQPHGIKVHAWLVATVTCRSQDALRGHPQHICTRHGPYVEGVPDDQLWTTATYDGTQVGDLDFGHPEALNYMVWVVHNLMVNYPNIDGLHFDFIRYSGQEYGYNQVSVDRFNRAYGLPANNWPVPDDPDWSQWRRDRMTELVRRLYVYTKSMNPHIQMSIAAITWGGIGSYTPEDWPNSTAYSAVFQDWKAWLEEGIIDFALPMHYFDEGEQRQRDWYDGWIAWDREHLGRRAIVAGLGSWLNTRDQNIAQIQRALEPDSAGRRLSGISLYAYHELFIGCNRESRRDFMQHLGATLFQEPARAPEWSWIINPTRGFIMGTAHIDGQTIPDAKVSLVKDGVWVRDITASGDGWYGAVELEPGNYTIVVENPADGRKSQFDTVVVVPGLVAVGS